MFIKIGRPIPLLELNKIKPVNISKNRSKVPILLVDDEGFVYEEEVRSNGFNIRVVRDIEDIRSVSEYPIIVCDIRGVGSRFGSELEGAHVIREIGKAYPEKVIIGYTGQKYDPAYQVCLQYCYRVLSKDIDSDAWIEHLDAAIKELLSPIASWRRVRRQLLESDVEVFDVLELEQAYIKSVSKSEESYFKKTSGSLADGGARKFAREFASGLIFRLIIEALR